MSQLNEHRKGAHPNRLANGHVTVEAALLIPLVIIVVVGIYTTALLGQRRATLQIIVQRAAELGSELIQSNGVLQLDPLMKDEVNSLYRHLLAEGGIRQEVRHYIISEVALATGVKALDDEIQVEISPLLYSSRVDTRIDQVYYFLPLGEFFGFPLKVNISVSGHAQCHNPTEFIRLVDMTYNLVNSEQIQNWGASLKQFWSRWCNE